MVSAEPIFDPEQDLLLAELYSQINFTFRAGPVAHQNAIATSLRPPANDVFSKIPATFDLPAVLC